MKALLYLIPLLMLSACSTATQLPPNLTQACPEPQIAADGPITNGEVVRYALDLKTSLRGCNSQLEAIREWLK